MNMSELLQELLDLLRTQVAHIQQGNHEAVRAAGDRHTEILAALDSAVADLPPAEIESLVRQIQREKQVVEALLTAELNRIDYLARLIVGGGQVRQSAYPAQGAPDGARFLNQYT